jgi:hypothetical protein
MSVKLCDRCPYLTQDLGELYDPKASFHLCVRCDGAAPSELTILTKFDGETKCAKVMNALSAPPRQRPAPSAAEGLV